MKVEVQPGMHLRRGSAGLRGSLHAGAVWSCQHCGLSAETVTANFVTERLIPRRPPDIGDSQSDDTNGQHGHILADVEHPFAARAPDSKWRGIVRIFEAAGGIESPYGAY